MPSIPIKTPPILLHKLRHILFKHSIGIREIDLIKHLQQEIPDLFSQDCLSDSLSLFRAHFILFNALYKLKIQLIEDEEAILDIGQIVIRLYPWEPSSSTNIAIPDPLQDYYLDLSKLQTTDQQQVEAMLDRFWQKFLAQDNVNQSLQILDLPIDSSWTEIKQRYKKLNQTMHPDKGGSTEAYQTLTAAYETLKKAIT